MHNGFEEKHLKVVNVVALCVKVKYVSCQQDTFVRVYCLAVLGVFIGVI